jgi:hypothetical protein
MKKTCTTSTVAAKSRQRMECASLATAFPVSSLRPVASVALQLTKAFPPLGERIAQRDPLRIERPNGGGPNPSPPRARRGLGEESIRFVEREG